MIAQGRAKASETSLGAALGSGCAPWVRVAHRFHALKGQNKIRAPIVNSASIGTSLCFDLSGRRVLAYDSQGSGKARGAHLTLPWAVMLRPLRGKLGTAGLSCCGPFGANWAPLNHAGPTIDGGDNDGYTSI